MPVCIIQQRREALAECGGRGPQVHGHIVHLSPNHPHQFSLGMLKLIMQAAQDILTGFAVVVLHKDMMAALSFKFILAESFHKKTAFIAMHSGNHQHGAVGGQRFEFHTFSAQRVCSRRKRYCP